MKKHYLLISFICISVCNISAADWKYKKSTRYTVSTDTNFLHPYSTYSKDSFTYDTMGRIIRKITTYVFEDVSGKDSQWVYSIDSTKYNQFNLITDSIIYYIGLKKDTVLNVWSHKEFYDTGNKKIIDYLNFGKIHEKRNVIYFDRFNNDSSNQNIYYTPKYYLGVRTAHYYSDKNILDSNVIYLFDTTNKIWNPFTITKFTYIGDTVFTVVIKNFVKNIPKDTVLYLTVYDAKGRKIYYRYTNYLKKKNLQSAETIIYDKKGNIVVRNIVLYDTFNKKIVKWLYKYYYSYYPDGELFSIKYHQYPDLSSSHYCNVTSYYYSGVFADLDKYHASDSKLHLYPNPASNTLSIELPQCPGQNTIEIKDLHGRVVWQMAKCKSETESIDISTISKGMYILILKNKEDIWVCKLVKE